MLAYRDISNGFKTLDLPAGQPVIAHASLSAFGEVRGGADTLLGALVNAFGRVMMPTFTYKTMLIPEEGPLSNGLAYGSGRDANRMSEFYSPSMPVDVQMGVLPEKLRQLPAALRSMHPILSFAGVGVDDALQAQTFDDPLAPIGALAAAQGWVLLLGVGHTVNTGIHYAEKLAGRTQFVRWALTPQGVRACPGFPGCSDGFEQIGSYLEGMARYVKIGGALVQAIPIEGLIAVVQGLLAHDPTALLCARPVCERCDAVRAALNASEN